MPAKKKRVKRTVKRVKRTARKTETKKTKVRSAKEEVALLQEGHVPETSKLGEKFKGKNKIIVS